MAKITSVIDIGSNSARMAIFRRTSRYGFYLIYEVKSKVRISEGSYENNGILQEIPMRRAIDAIKEFVAISKNHKAKKLLCVATSAVRDAPNKAEFIKAIKKECGVNIRVIDGRQEALYGGIACVNLSHQKSGISIDIGGGSTECALIIDGKIVDLISLNIGTIRLKELFLDTGDIKGAKQFIKNELKKLPIHYRHNVIYGVGGSIRALAKMIIKSSKYPINEVHGFEMDVKSNIKFLEKLYSSPSSKLSELGVPNDRIDNIQSGTLILKMLLDTFDTKTIITSGVGVREGVFLSDLLRSSKASLPKDINPSLISVTDRFMLDRAYALNLKKECLALFDVLSSLHKCDREFAHHLGIAAYLCQIGRILNFYGSHTHGSYMLLNALDYGFSHRDRAIICMLVAYSNKKIPKDNPIVNISNNMPDLKTIQWLCFILGLGEMISKVGDREKIKYILDKKHLEIYSTQNMYLAREEISKIQKPSGLEISFIKE